MNALVRIMDFEIRGRSFFSGQLVNINADLLFGANQLLMLPLVLSVTQQLAGARMTIDQRLGLVNRNRQIAASLNVVIVLTNVLALFADLYRLRLRVRLDMIPNRLIAVCSLERLPLLRFSILQSLERIKRFRNIFDPSRST